MAKVINKIGDSAKHVITQGDFFVDGDGDFFILTRTGSGTDTQWLAIALADGNRWVDPQNTPHEATDGLIFVLPSNKVKITIQSV